jgi:hypothetical protein
MSQTDFPLGQYSKVRLTQSTTTHHNIMQNEQEHFLEADLFNFASITLLRKLSSIPK